NPPRMVSPITFSETRPSWPIDARSLKSDANGKRTSNWSPGDSVCSGVSGTPPGIGVPFAILGALGPQPASQNIVAANAIAHPRWNSDMGCGRQVGRGDMITLYQQHDSGNCYKVRLVLRHLGREFRTVAISSFDGSTRKPEFLAKNPIGKVPTI